MIMPIIELKRPLVEKIKFISGYRNNIHFEVDRTGVMRTRDEHLGRPINFNHSWTGDTYVSFKNNFYAVFPNKDLINKRYGYSLERLNQLRYLFSNIINKC